MFHRIFIANRGEVAVRVARACDAMGITPVFGVSSADAQATYVAGRETVLLGGASAKDSYLRIDRILAAAKEKECTAVHPGRGFLSESPLFARMMEDHGVTFIGPPAHAMALMGTKTPAKRAMGAAGLTLIPGSEGILRDAAHALEVAKSVGFPVLLKAEYGGGGRGMRIARRESEVTRAFEDATSESLAAFGNGAMYLEKLVEHGRHIEIQLMADRYGNVVHLGERDCTVQRNHQKLIEESGSPALNRAERDRTAEAAVRAVRSIGYVGAGTMEFLLDGEGTLRFMEMNTRLQVEHCVTEMRTGLDLVREQIRVAAGYPLSVAQKDVRFDGHAIECRINAEDPSQNFQPSPGVIRTWKSPTGDGIRVDTHVSSGYEVPPFYDSLLCKVIAHGADRQEATARMLRALDELVCDGVKTTVPLHRAVLASNDWSTLNYDTGRIPGWAQPAAARKD